MMDLNSETRSHAAFAAEHGKIGGPAMEPILEHASLDELWTIIHRIQAEHQLPHERNILASYLGRESASAVRSILDIGCGNGVRTLELSRQFPAARLVGVESNPTLVAEARKVCSGARVEILQGDILQTPFEGECFDLVHVRFMLHLLTPAERALALLKVASVSREGTIVFAIDHDTQLHLVYPPCGFLARMRQVAAGLEVGARFDGAVGRTLPSLLAQAGFGDFSFELSCLDLFRIGRNEFLELIMAQARVLAAHVPDAFDETSLREGQAELERWLDAGGGLSLGASCCVLGRKMKAAAS